MLKSKLNKIKYNFKLNHGDFDLEEYVNEVIDENYPKIKEELGLEKDVHLLVIERPLFGEANYGGYFDSNANLIVIYYGAIVGLGFPRESMDKMKRILGRNKIKKMIINILAHEMCHAKQYELMGTEEMFKDYKSLEELLEEDKSDRPLVVKKIHAVLKYPNQKIEKEADEFAKEQVEKLCK